MKEGMFMAVSDAQKKASVKYDKANMSSIGLKVPRSERALIEQMAQQANKPLARYIRDCVKYCIEHDIQLH